LPGINLSGSVAGIQFSGFGPDFGSRTESTSVAVSALLLSEQEQRTWLKILIISGLDHAGRRL